MRILGTIYHDLVESINSIRSLIAAEKRVRSFLGKDMTFTYSCWLTDVKGIVRVF